MTTLTTVLRVAAIKLQGTSLTPLLAQNRRECFHCLVNGAATLKQIPDQQRLAASDQFATAEPGNGLPPPWKGVS